MCYGSPGPGPISALLNASRPSPPGLPDSISRHFCHLCHLSQPSEETITCTGHESQPRAWGFSTSIHTSDSWAPHWAALPQTAGTRLTARLAAFHWESSYDFTPLSHVFPRLSRAARASIISPLLVLENEP